jgi:signal transduction histidine kinase
MNSNHSESTPLILVVDDEQKNLQVLGNLLAEKKYRLDFATNGEEALDLAKSYSPDLILLDVMMPKIDGFEVCEKLKKEKITQNIPIIFITAKHEDEDIIKGFECGGVDYICKPFKTQELLARVHTHLNLVLTRKALQKANDELVLFNEMKSEFLGIACHDLKNPLSGIVWHADLLKDSIQNYENSHNIQSSEELEILSIIESSASNMLQIINNIMDTEFLESGKVKMDLASVDLGLIAQQIFQINKASAKKKSIDLLIETEQNLFSIVDVSRVREIMDNLLSNAIKYSPRNKTVSLKIVSKNDKILFIVQDEGPGFSDQDKKEMYGKFARLSARPTGDEISTGLGLSIVKNLVELLKATIVLESKPGHGATFTVSFDRN